MTRPVVLALAALVCAGGCPNEHVFQVIDPCSSQTVAVAPVPVTNKSDILIVVDNSASMCEEQANLRNNFFLDGCAIDVNDPPSPADVTDEMLAGCGFVQALYAFDLDFRLGVITTDVGLCDNRTLQAGKAERACEGVEPDWGRRPQRGCLQAPADAERKYLQRGDADLDDKFAAILAGVKTYGSAIERGLDATQAFIDADTPHDECRTDRDDFLRDDAALVVIYLTDEDDCSHPATGAFGDETTTDTCDGFGDTLNQTWGDNATACYANKDQLTPVDDYVAALQQVKEGRVRVAVIAGGEPVADSDPVRYAAADCRIDAAGGPDTMCTAPRGQGGPFVLTSPASDCFGLDPSACCIADAGERYYQLAAGFDASVVRTDSICKDSYQQTMLDIAKLASIADVVSLGEAPASPLLIRVEVESAGTTTQPVRIDDDVGDPEAEGLSGWQYQAPTTIRFYGDAVPGAGQQVRVFFAAASAEECTE